MKPAHLILNLTFVAVLWAASLLIMMLANFGTRWDLDLDQAANWRFVVVIAGPILNALWWILKASMVALGSFYSPPMDATAQMAYRLRAMTMIFVAEAIADVVIGGAGFITAAIVGIEPRFTIYTYWLGITISTAVVLIAGTIAPFISAIIAALIIFTHTPILILGWLIVTVLMTIVRKIRKHVRIKATAEELQTVNDIDL